MNLRKKLLTAFFLVFIGLILTHSENSLSLALKGLNLWFQKMIPTLVPFMILSGIMVRMNLTEDFAGLFTPLLKPLFRISANGVYCIVMGFLCGFPMGAKVITELYEREKLSNREASYLLSFCNNIGPIYFLGFALPTIGISNHLSAFLFGMYGIPLLYGILLRYTVYGNQIHFRKKSVEPILTDPVRQDSLLFSINDAILSALNSITALGGYMIFFNLLNLLPMVLLENTLFSFLLPILNAFMEITGGLHMLGSALPPASLILLTFGGLSCISQTYSIICRTDLSIKSYVLHKLCLSIFTAAYYVFVL